MRFIQSLFLFSALNLGAFCLADDQGKDAAVSCEDKKTLAADMVKETDHVIQINGANIPYKAKVGTLTIKDEKDEPKAQIFYIAYTRSDASDLTKRPVTFCFNGGPGSSSVWLHMGAFGPKRVMTTAEGAAVQPFQLEDNQYSLLDLTDLVFIDPVATGYSKSAPGVDAKQFFSVKEDIASVAEFIRMYTTLHSRWQSPKFVAGESYGTTRAAGLSWYLQDKYFMSLDGVILISSVMDWQTLNLNDRYNGNDLPSILALPTFAASAWYYKKIQGYDSLDSLLSEVEQFALTDYTLALMQGNKLENSQKDAIVQKLMKFTGISKDFLTCSDMRLDVGSFTKQLLKPEQKLVSVYDTRLEGIDLNPCDSFATYDPGLEMLTSAYTACFNNYIKTELNWSRESEYKILANVFPWNYEPAVNQFLNVAIDLRDTITRTMSMKVFVASGLFDLATPYFATEYTLDHMQLSPDLKGNVTRKFYPGGHMMYLNEPNLQNLKADLTAFFGQIMQPTKAK